MGCERVIQVNEKEDNFYYVSVSGFLMFAGAVTLCFFFACVPDEVILVMVPSWVEALLTSCDLGHDSSQWAQLSHKCGSRCWETQAALWPEEMSRSPWSQPCSVYSCTSITIAVMVINFVPICPLVLFQLLSVVACPLLLLLYLLK